MTILGRPEIAASRAPGNSPTTYRRVHVIGKRAFGIGQGEVRNGRTGIAKPAVADDTLRRQGDHGEGGERESHVVMGVEEGSG